MSVTFTKLFSSITESTVWCEPDSTRIVWITMLAMADSKGRVWGSIPGLANRARVTIEQCENALITFRSPDKYSRTPDNEGRRIEDIDGGWLLLNYLKHRAVQDEVTIRESKRQWAERNRASKKVEKVEVDRSQSRQEEEEEEGDKSITPKVKSRGVATASRLPADWAPNDADVAYCKTERPDLNVARTVDSFRDYWHAKPGPTARKLDWAATWRSWVRNEKSNGQQPQNRHDERMARLSALTGGRAGNRPTGMFAVNAGTVPALIEKKEPV